MSKKQTTPVPGQPFGIENSYQITITMCQRKPVPEYFLGYREAQTTIYKQRFPEIALPKLIQALNKSN